MFAVIGGTGIGDRLSGESGRAVHVPTEFGLFLGRDLGWCLAVERHGLGHRVPPSDVNYLAIAAGLRRLGVEGCISTAAVGGISPSAKRGALGICADFVDFSGRHLTAFASSVQHTDFSNALSGQINEMLKRSATELGIAELSEWVYACANGPRYETPAEILAMQKLGCDVVGMTMASEAISMRELGVPYSCLAIVTNDAAGVSKNALAHSEVVESVKESANTVMKLIRRTLQA